MKEYPKSVTKKSTQKILEQLDNSIYKIYKNKEIFDFGFFCRLKYRNKNIPVLITSNRIINKRYLKFNNSIIIEQNSKIIDIEFGSVKYIDKYHELSVIEIKESMSNFIYFLELDNFLYEKEPELYYKDESLYIIQNNNSVTYGVVNNIINSEIIFSCNININSNDYSPIFNLSNNKVIGLYQNKSKYYKKGIFFKLIIKEFINELKEHNNNFYNEIKISIEIEKDDIGKKIYFIGNNKIKTDKYYHEIWNENNERKELDKFNTNIYIDNQKYEFKNYFIPEEIKKIEIKLIISKNLRTLSFMFANCKKIKSIDFISFNTKKIKNMEYMFCGCEKLEKVNLFCFNTKNVVNMSYMFSHCYNLNNLDLSSFNTNNFVYLSNMFNFCKKLKKFKTYSLSIKDKIIYQESKEKKNLNNIKLYFSNIRNINKLTNFVDDVRLRYSLHYIVIGPISGKTSIIKRFTEDKFNEYMGTTVGIDYNSKDIEILDKIVRINVIDTSGDESFMPTTSGSYANTVCCLVVYDITDRDNFNSVDRWIELYREYGPKTSLLLLIGNKNDLDDERTVMYEEGEELADKYGMLFFETSAKIGNDIDNLFYYTIIRILKRIKENYYKNEEKCGITFYKNNY